MAQTLTTGNSTASASQYTTATIQPAASELVLVFVSNARAPLVLGTLATPTVTGNGLTWEQVTTIVTPDGDRRLTCLRALDAGPTRDALVIDFADQKQDMCAWSVFEYAGLNGTGTNGSGAVGSSQTLTAIGAQLIASAPPADPTRDLTVGAIVLETNDAQAHPVSAGPGFTEIHQQTPSKSGHGLTLQTQDSGPGTGTIEWTWTSELRAVSLVLSLRGAPDPETPEPTVDPTVALIGRFEPILHLHPMESFVPVNAKRYLENAALWAATVPFDDKNSWGAAPLVKAKHLSGVQSEPGKYLGEPDLIGHGVPTEAFLELGGWKDKDQIHEPDTAAENTNLYADRKAIVDAYQGALDDSKFWYHAELFDTARLQRLAGSVTAPDLSKTLQRFTHPALLCYYLFYPAHEESSGGECDTVEAKELACHAGDWHCIAILLEGDGTTDPAAHTPVFFGVTGPRPAPVMRDGAESYRPYEFDAERRTAMRVEAWRRGSPASPIQPSVIGEHPRFYVARGTHGMYTAAGDQQVSPYDDDSRPLGCGTFDTPSAIPPKPAPPGRPSEEDNLHVLLAKIIGGGLLGSIGLGLLAWAIELIPQIPRPLIDVDGPFGDSPTPDATSTAGQGTTIRPKDLAIPDVAGGLQNWVAEADVQVGGRRYGIVVDRATQVWWPADDGHGGFRGRWGQRVTADPLPRRAGVLLPEFWKMFLSALEQGFGTGDLTR